MVLRDQGKCSVDRTCPLHILPMELHYLREETEQSRGEKRAERHERRGLRKKVKEERPARTGVEQDQATVSRLQPKHTVTMCEKGLLRFPEAVRNILGASC